MKTMLICVLIVILLDCVGCASQRKIICNVAKFDPITHTFQYNTTTVSEKRIK